MVATAHKNALNWADISVIAAPGNCNVRITDQAVVRGVKIDPTEWTTPRRTPRVRYIGTNQPRLARRWRRAQVTAYIARGNPHAPQTTRRPVSKVLAYPTPQPQDFP